MDMMEIRRRVMQGVGDLPPGYQRAKYIKTDGWKSYFDTGIPGNDNTLQFDLIYTVHDGRNYGAILGNYDGNRNHNCWVLRDFNSTNRQNYTLNCGSFAVGQSTTNFSVDTLVGKLIKVRIAYKNIAFVVDGVLYSQTVSENIADVSNANIFIGNFPATVNYGYSHSFYGLKISKGGKLIRDYVPCIRKSDNKAGFYDLVNYTFNPSIGTSDFVAGYDN